LKLARDCPYPEALEGLEPFEAYLEAAIVFGRVAIHRQHLAASNKAKNKPRLKAEVNEWWNSLLGNPSVEFFRRERDFISKEGPPKVGQLIRLGGPPGQKAEELYYFESPEIPATETVERHLDSVEKIIEDAESRFGTSTLLGLREG
jgi:hypothetical protein